MTGIILMAAYLVVVAVFAGAIYFLSRLLPVDNPARMGVAAAIAWIRQNPRVFEKRLRQVAFGLIVLVFSLITIIYS
jgi:hypothetical protein